MSGSVRIWRRNRKRWYVIVEFAALVICQNENRVLPCVAIHERRNDGLDIKRAALDVIRGMFVRAARSVPTINENNLWQHLVGIAGACTAGSRQSVHQITLGESFWLDRRILKIREVCKENSIFVVVDPAHVRGVHGAEDRGCRIQRVACRIGVFMSKRRSRHQEHPVWHCIGKNRGMPSIAGAKESCQIVVVRQVLFSVIGHCPCAIGIILVDKRCRAVQEPRHTE